MTRIKQKVATSISSFTVNLEQPRAFAIQSIEDALSQFLRSQESILKKSDDAEFFYKMKITTYVQVKRFLLKK